MNRFLSFICWLFKDPEEALSSKIIHGGIWTFATQIFTRILTFTRTIILARLLSPNDFGLMGIAFLALSTLQTFSETGVNIALIHRQENNKEELDVAWTLRFLRSLLIFFLLLLSAPYIASFFNNPDATNIIRFIAVGYLFYGFSNIAIIKFQKEIEFHKYFLFSICSTIPEVVVAVAAAIILKNVWALVIGYLVGAIANCIFSYVFCPFKPKFSLQGVYVRSLLGYGKWIWASTIIIFLITQGDDIFVGKFLGATALGLYQLAYRISNLPATEIVHVISRVSFPAYVKVRNDLQELKRLYLRFFKISIMLSFVTSFIILAISDLFILEIVGKKWLDVLLPLKILCIFSCLRGIGAANGSFFRAIGNPDIETKLSFLKLILLAILIYPFAKKFFLSGVALATTLPSFLHNFLGFLFIKRFFVKNGLNFQLTTLFWSMFLALIFSVFAFTLTFIPRFFFGFSKISLFVSLVMGVGFLLFLTFERIKYGKLYY